jgi:vesicle transport protein SEC22
MSIQSDKMVFYYMSRENLCFLCLTEDSYPKRLAFLYLEEVADTLLQEMVREYGNGVRNVQSSSNCIVLYDIIVSHKIHPISCPRRLTLSWFLFCLSTSQWRETVDQAARPFQFIHYDPIIQRKQREFRDQDEHKNNSRLNEDLSEIQSIMKKNIDEILNRGEKLDHVSNISNELKMKSKDFKWGAKKLTFQARMQQYGPMFLGGAMILIVLYVKIFHIGF